MIADTNGRWRVPLAAVALASVAGGCLDYRLGRREPPVPEPPPDTEQPVDVCQGTDPAPRHAVAVEAACTGVEIAADPWSVDVEWRVDAPYGGSVAPVVAPLSDSTGDGVIDARDTPIVAVDLDGAVVIADGATGSVLGTLARTGTGIVIANVGGDPAPELLLATRDGTVTAWSSDGALLWESESLVGEPAYPMLTAADVDADGDVECVADRMILDGATGATRATTVEAVEWWRSPVVADIDGDGFAEILLKDGVYSHRGELLWKGPLDERSVFTAVVNADDDAEAEIVFVGGQDATRYALVDTSGEVLVDVVVPGGDPGTPCVADMDGDGEPEVAIAGKYLTVVELDGTIVWSLPVNDPSGLAGCSAADLDLDGAAEIVYADEHDLRIVSGRTGEVHAIFSEHQSNTLFEYPLIADVDLDGSAEIVVVSSERGDGAGWSGVTVLGQRDDRWPRPEFSWPIHDFAPGRVNSDGSVPSPIGAPWLEHDMFRAMPTTARVDAADVRAVITEVCVTSCDEGGEIVVAWQAANHGAAASAPDVVDLLAVDQHGASRVLASAEIGIIPPGDSPEGSLFTVAAAEMRGLTLGLALRASGDCFDRPHRFVGDVVCP